MNGVYLCGIQIWYVNITMYTHDGYLVVPKSRCNGSCRGHGLKCRLPYVDLAGHTYNSTTDVGIVVQRMVYEISEKFCLRNL